MLALVLAQTLRHGSREGCKVALAPLLTDVPIILVTLALASKLAQARSLLGVGSIAGGLFVLYLAWESLTPLRRPDETATEQPRSWLKGVVTNVLNPHPWLFWLTVGAAILAKAMSQSRLVAAAFLLGFYLLLVGSKMLVALLAGRSREFLAGPRYVLAMRILAVMLALFALLLFREGLRHLALI